MIIQAVSWGWSEILWASLIGFVLVFVVLIRMAAAGRKQAVAPQPMISQEEIAAIATALKIYKSVLHDRESEVVTILSIKRAYSPWNSKIHGLTQLPERK